MLSLQASLALQARGGVRKGFQSCWVNRFATNVTYAVSAVVTAVQRFLNLFECLLHIAAQGQVAGPGQKPPRRHRPYACYSPRFFLPATSTCSSSVIKRSRSVSSFALCASCDTGIAPLLLAPSVLLPTLRCEIDTGKYKRGVILPYSPGIGKHQRSVALKPV